MVNISVTKNRDVKMDKWSKVLLVGTYVPTYLPRYLLYWISQTLVVDSIIYNLSSFANERLFYLFVLAIPRGIYARFMAIRRAA